MSVGLHFAHLSRERAGPLRDAHLGYEVLGGPSRATRAEREGSSDDHFGNRACGRGTGRRHTHSGDHRCHLVGGWRDPVGPGLYGPRGRRTEALLLKEMSRLVGISPRWAAGQTSPHVISWNAKGARDGLGRQTKGSPAITVGDFTCGRE